MSRREQDRTLEAAWAYEGRYGRLIDASDRPLFHLSPYVGWMNDPNGFSRYDGRYHLFYQYNPYSTQWNAMHWGHAVSDDLLRWEHLPCALAPDRPYDHLGCFSGSAIELHDGRHLLMYTGVQGAGRTEQGVPVMRQVQCVAVGDGIAYEKYEGNPVISGDALPAGLRRSHFRDPRVWRGEDGSYRCVVGAVDADKDGLVLLFSSKDALSWSYEGVLARNGGRFGTMWECPDLFELDGRMVLLASPQDMLVEERERLGGGALYCIGRIDGRSGAFDEEGLWAIDGGIDFYAPQTLLTPDGRRVMVAWMQNWDTTRQDLPDKRWFGQMTLPRELRVRAGRLCQWPVRELEDLRHGRVTYQDVTLEGDLVLEGIEGRCVDLTLSVRPQGSGMYRTFSLNVAEGRGCVTMLSLNPREGLLKLDRTRSGSRHMVMHVSECSVPMTGSSCDLRVILDRHSIEVFANRGAQTMTMVVPTDLAATGISFHADGELVMDVEKYILDADADGVDVR